MAMPLSISASQMDVPGGASMVAGWAQIDVGKYANGGHGQLTEL